MQSTNGKKPTTTSAMAVGGALRRAGEGARKTARAHGAPANAWPDGKVATQEPWFAALPRLADFS